MKSPCHECTRRTVMPNCHADCEEYQKYADYRQKIRDARQKEQDARTATINRATKLWNETYRKRRK